MILEKLKKREKFPHFVTCNDWRWLRFIINSLYFYLHILSSKQSLDKF